LPAVWALSKRSYPLSSMPTSVTTPDGRPIGNFDQPVLPIQDPSAFHAVRKAIEGAFATGRVAGFLKSLMSRRLRIRDFESVLGKGLLGSGTRTEYDRLGNADQGQIREFYLRSLETVPVDLRDKFFKLYAYY
jgi:hypothetical protein